MTTVEEQEVETWKEDGAIKREIWVKTELGLKNLITGQVLDFVGIANALETGHKAFIFTEAPL